MKLADVTLADGSPALDHLGRDVTVFVLGSPPLAVGELVEGAMATARAVKVVRVPFTGSVERWGGRLVVTDSRGEVSFRGDHTPHDVEELLAGISRPDRSG